MLYQLFRPFLFSFDAETAHNLALSGMNLTPAGAMQRLFGSKVPSRPTTVMGLEFKNPVGLAAGMDKNGDHVDALGELGFGFIEVGSTTPKAQPGNPKPRMFRIPEAEGIINRLGFNNKGVDHLVEAVSERTFDGILGINIGKNKITPNDKAVDDYLNCLQKVYTQADYVTVNISSPNTPGLRNLQHGDALTGLLDRLKKEQKKLADTHNKYVPLAVKIAPDLTAEELKETVDCILKHNIDGIITTNTTNSRDSIDGFDHAYEEGGLSGKPLNELSLSILKQVKAISGDDLPIIAVGGIMSGADAKARLDAGASLVQIYTGFVYKGPELIRHCVEAV